MQNKMPGYDYWLAYESKFALFVSNKQTKNHIVYTYILNIYIFSEKYLKTLYYAEFERHLRYRYAWNLRILHFISHFTCFSSMYFFVINIICNVFFKLFCTNYPICLNLLHLWWNSKKNIKTIRTFSFIFTESLLW